MNIVAVKKLILNPFTVEVENVPEIMQEEIIQLQNQLGRFAWVCCELGRFLVLKGYGIFKLKTNSFTLTRGIFSYIFIWGARFFFIFNHEK